VSPIEVDADHLRFTPRCDDCRERMSGDSERCWRARPPGMASETGSPLPRTTRGVRKRSKDQPKVAGRGPWLLVISTPTAILTSLWHRPAATTNDAGSTSEFSQCLEVPSRAIFTDGFESGDISGWSSAQS